MLRADEGFGNLRIMLPMISTLEEVDAAKALIVQARVELLEEGYQARMPQIGVMIEVPAAVYQIDRLASRVDFLSVGTNDLTQYLLAVDRNNRDVADLYDDLHPAVLRALCQIAEGAAAAGRELSICGEMAGSPRAAVLLLAMGVNCLSMSAGGLLPVKAVIRAFTLDEARQGLQQALACENAAEVRGVLSRLLEAKGLGGLVRPGR